MPAIRHRIWVKICHWAITASFLLLAFTGFKILMVHPRLYWGEVGNDLTPSLFELPISRNYKHGGWGQTEPFFSDATSPVSASRTYDIFNENGWGRSLHFLSAWILVAVGLIYLLMGILTGHIKKRLIPDRGQFTLQLFWQDLKEHMRMRIPDNGIGKYNLLQKYAYLSVVFFLLPLMVLTGFTMAPAIIAAFPFLLDLFGGTQSARTIHFFSSVAIELFLIVHLIMVIRSGFKQQIRAMTIGT
jgi:thiosulfate reductase cytochrome b subunit